MRRRWSSLRFLLLALLLLLCAAPAVAAESFLVVPFENLSGGADLDWVGESFAEALAANLSGPGVTVFTREERLAALEKLGLPPVGPLTRASLLRLGQELEADRVVIGRFEIEGGHLRAEARWLAVAALSLSRPVEQSGSLDQLLEVQAWLTWRLLRQLDSTFPWSFQDYRQRLPRLSVSAFENYVRGLLAMQREQQLRYFLQAAHLEPSYTLPAFHLAQLYFEDHDYAAARRWFEKIPDGDPLALDAGFYLALCHFFTGEFARASETLAPLASQLPVKDVWNNLGVFASRQGDPAAALAHFHRALEEDPDDPDLYFNLGLHHLRHNQWEEAARALKRCLEIAPRDTEALFLRARALEQLGHEEDARRARLQAVGDNPALDLSLERRWLELDRLAVHFSARQARAGREVAASAAAHETER
ncbi:MAG: tetratricopeptide repeat protein [Acidobacteria bacterium]|nr:tetratricopeptide repeat protein [Acidobacteriota bacterium]